MGLHEEPSVLEIKHTVTLLSWKGG